MADASLNASGGGALEEAQAAIDRMDKEREAISGADAKEKGGG